MALLKTQLLLKKLGGSKFSTNKGGNPSNSQSKTKMYPQIDCQWEELI